MIIDTSCFFARHSGQRGRGTGPLELGSRGRRRTGLRGLAAEPRQAAVPPALGEQPQHRQHVRQPVGEVPSERAAPRPDAR